LDQGAQIGFCCGLRRRRQLGYKPSAPVSPFRNRKGKYWRPIRELDANAVNSNCTGRIANPVASAIPGQALILAGLLLLRRP
jgi:hypothetical protein